MQLAGSGSHPSCRCSCGFSPWYDSFSRREITPSATDNFERRLERELRAAGRVVVQATFREIESSDPHEVVGSFEFLGSSYRRNRRTNKEIDTRFGTITLDRWFYQNTQAGAPGLAPLDVRLGLFANRATPALAEVAGRLAGDLPQQAVLEMLHERFNVRPGVGTLRRIVADVSKEVRAEHDDLAIQQVLAWLREAGKSRGKRDILLQAGRDGIFVPIRPCWEEASCATLSVFNRRGRRLGTIYLGQMPQANQTTMSERLTNVLTCVLKQLGSHLPTLRYVTDAGSHPQAYFRDVLQVMKHPATGELLQWSWGVDFYHACEYVSKLAASLFGSNTQEARDWAREQRRILRDDPKGVQRVVRSAAQQRRRHGLTGTKADYAASLNYFKNYRAHMDYADRRSRGEPIGSGITEAGCKVIFSQRLKQSGMRWRRDTGQYIVDLRTALRSGIWPAAWARILRRPTPLPPLTKKSNAYNSKSPEKPALPR